MSRTTQEIQDVLAALESSGLRRRLRFAPPRTVNPAPSDGDGWLDFSSNDYLALARDAHVIEAAADALRSGGTGATGSRLMSGHLPLHAEVEQALAEWLQAPAVLLFGCGFLANLGLLSSLADSHTVVFEDRLNHASLLDGVRMSGARRVRYRHGDAEHLRTLLRRHAGAARRWVVTDTLFSMDGDMAPLRAIDAVCAENDVPWMADEAHALGVYGPGGRGGCAAAGVRPDLLVGTFSKALGGYGGFVACAAPLREYLVNRARSFIYTTAPAPAAVGAALGALERIRDDPEMGVRLRARAAKFRRRLQEGGLDVTGGDSPIVPVLLGGNDRAMAVSGCLEAERIRVVAIRPPTVPAGTARLRLSVTRNHGDDDLNRAADAVVRAVRSVASRRSPGRRPEA